MKNSLNKVGITFLFFLLASQLFFSSLVTNLLPVFAQTNDPASSVLFTSDLFDVTAAPSDNGTTLQVQRKEEAEYPDFSEVQMEFVFAEPIITDTMLKTFEEDRPDDRFGLDNGTFIWKLPKNSFENARLTIPVSELPNAELKVFFDDALVYDSQTTMESSTSSTDKASETSTSSIEETNSKENVSSSQDSSEKTSEESTTSSLKEKEQSSSISKSQNSVQKAAQAVKSSTDIGPQLNPRDTSQLAGTHYDDLFSYNVYASGNHSANQADTEGGIAVKGNSAIVAGSNAGFNYGGYFDNPGSGLGHTLGPEQNVSLMLQGKIYAQHIAQNSKAKIGDGLAVLNEKFEPFDETNWPKVAFPGPNEYKDTGVVPLTDAELTSTFNKLDSQLNDFTNQLDRWVSQTDEYQAGNQTLANDGTNLYPIKQYEIRVSRANERVLVVNVPKLDRPDGSIAILPQIQMDYLNITDPDLNIDKIVITTDAEKVAVLAEARGTSLSVKDDVSHGNAISKRVVFYAPNAKQFSTFRPDGWTWDALDIPSLDTDPAIGGAAAASQGVNNYDETKDAYGPNFLDSGRLSTHPMVWGSIVAPKAITLISGGSVNGYIFTKDFHQRGGAEAHNFINPPVLDKVEPDQFTVHVTKYWNDDKTDQSVLLKGAKFILKKTQNGEASYYTGNTAEPWLGENHAKEYTTNDYGRITIEGLPKEEGATYSVVETATPNKDFEIINKETALEKSEDGENYSAAVENKYVGEPKDLQLILRKTNESGKPLVGAEFTLLDDQKNVVEVQASKMQRPSYDTLRDAEFSYVVFDEKLAPEKTYYVYESRFPESYGSDEDTPTVENPLVVKVDKDSKVTISRNGVELAKEDFLDTNDTSKAAVVLKPAVKNVLRDFDIKIQKSDQDGKALAGVKFRVEGNGKEFNEVTDDKGVAHFKDLAIDQKYEIKEMEGTSGYAGWQGTIIFDMNNQGEGPILKDENGHVIPSKDFDWDPNNRILILKIKNGKMAQIPTTGGIGNKWFIVSVVIVLAGYAGYQLSKNKEENNEEKV